MNKRASRSRKKSPPSGIDSLTHWKNLPGINLWWSDVAGVIRKRWPKRTPAEWADQTRVLPPGTPEPGPWRTNRTPYMEPIYRAMLVYKTVVAITASQMGKALALDT